MGFPLSSCISYKLHLYFLRHEPASVSSQRLRQPSSLMSLAIHPDDAAWSFLLRLDPSDNDSPSLTLGFTTLWRWSLELWWDNPQGHWTGNSSEMKTIFLPHTWIRLNKVLKETFKRKEKEGRKAGRAWMHCWSSTWERSKLTVVLTKTAWPMSSLHLLSASLFSFSFNHQIAPNFPFSRPFPEKFLWTILSDRLVQFWSKVFRWKSSVKGLVRSVTRSQHPASCPHLLLQMLLGSPGKIHFAGVPVLLLLEHRGQSPIPTHLFSSTTRAHALTSHPGLKALMNSFQTLTNLSSASLPAECVYLFWSHCTPNPPSTAEWRQRKAPHLLAQCASWNQTLAYAASPSRSDTRGDRHPASDIQLSPSKQEGRGRWHWWMTASAQYYPKNSASTPGACAAKPQQRTNLLLMTSEMILFIYRTLRTPASLAVST